MFKPKLFTIFHTFNREQLTKDLIAGIVVGILALPLSIAFAIASGVSPDKGLFTAIIAGFLISFLGGSRVQIGGPTGAFIVIVYGIVQQYGIDGLTVATIMAGLMLIAMGFARLGQVIKFIPYPLIVGFTTGIALIIFSSQMKDFFGLRMGVVPADFIEKWMAYVAHFSTANPHAIGLGLGTIFISLLFGKVSQRIPGSLVAILLSTIAVQYFQWPVETIGSRFGAIPSGFPSFSIPSVDWAMIKGLFQPAFTIALLGGIESLLSAVVADGMIGKTHRSNMELVAQGVANVVTPFFGGIPATGAIARTATNVKNGGRTPVAGIVHAITLLCIVLFVGHLAVMIPLACLAGILVVIAYNMSEWRSFRRIAQGRGSDAVVLVVTFLLTVLLDLTVAIEVGMVLAAFLFMTRMSQLSHVDLVKDLKLREQESESVVHPMDLSNFIVPKGIRVFEVSGPMFFGAAYKFQEEIKHLETPPPILILRMRYVPMIDATGLRAVEDVYREVTSQGTKLVLSGVQPPVLEELRKSRLLFKIGKGNVLPDFAHALERATRLLENAHLEDPKETDNDAGEAILKDLTPVQGQHP
ncbi:MAG TPA: sodium-independent anion transporter [Bacteroidetes bacterium]|nr:sodium-independent anion transporter [Bacteroidota bacterium]HRR09808.1 sulfate permease [Rhodothermales bacterium]